LPTGYEWCTVNLADENEATEVYNLLTNHYVEDSDGKFRFDYSIDFLRWALTPPGHVQDWVIGVRGEGKLSGFISATPVTMVINGNRVQMGAVNFLCVHKKLRNLRLAPTLIKELTRRGGLCGQF
jgi:glycylpeptide N-tetradecanoyltransferase